MNTQTIDFSNMTEEECEAWMEQATGIKIGTTEALAVKAIKDERMVAIEEINSGTRSLDTMAEEECRAWIEQAKKRHQSLSPSSNLQRGRSLSPLSGQ